MSKIIYQYSKQSYMRLVILFFILLNIAAIETQAQTLSIISTDDSLGISCVGETRTYKLTDTVSGVSYTWSVSPAGQCNIIYVSNTQVQIQWFEANIYPGFQIIVNGSDNSTANRNETVLEALSPFIIASTEVGCQEPTTKHDSLSNIIVEDSSGCIKVCENSMITYHAKDMFPFNDTSYRFEWTITGGLFYALNSGGLLYIVGTTITNSNFSGHPLDSVIVRWGAAGMGNITTTEFCEYGCTPKSYTVCIEKIKTPKAKFIFDNLADLHLDSCYEICLNQTINFQDLSTSNSDSLGLFWEWDFGDGSPTAISVLQNPSHTYSTPGHYTVSLLVTNKCGCTAVCKRGICVLEQESPKIYCASVVCENNTAIYHTDADCEYHWDIAGGTQLSPFHAQDVTVKWDNVGADGFGYVSLFGETCEGHCPNPTTIRIPVIQAHGSINGSLNVCPNTNYHYTLPAWPATNFTWEIIENGYTGSIPTSYLDNSNEIEIKTGNIAGKFWLVCNYINTIVDCKGSDTIEVIIGSKPIITAPTESCKATAVSCSLNPPNGNPGVIWKVIKPNGNVVTQNASAYLCTFPASIFNVSGTYTIQASNPDFSCDPDPVTVKIIDPPAAPAAISGENKVCLHYPYTYTVSNMPNTTASWTITGGVVSGTTATTATGNIVSVTWNSSGTKTLAVSRRDNISGCSSTAYSKPITHIVVSGSIAKTPDSTAIVCEDATEMFNLTLNNAVVGEAYEWSVYPPQRGSITAGQGTTSCHVTFNHAGASSNCVVRCLVTKCGQNTLVSLAVTIKATTSITAVIPSDTNICSNTPVTFTAITSGAPASSFMWDFGNGYTLTTTTNTTGPTPDYANYGNNNETYIVSVKAVSSCNSAVSDAATTTIYVLPQPSANISPGGTDYVCMPDTIFSFPVTISNNSSGTFTYQWYFKEQGTTFGKLISGTTFPTYTITNALPNANPLPASSFGTYWVKITNTATGCFTITNERKILPDSNCGIVGCTPVEPAGISNFTTTLLSCGQVQANCTTLGSLGTNIVSYYWSFFNNNIPYYTNPPPPDSTQNTSPIYNVSQPGLYHIKIWVNYLNAIPEDSICTRTASANIIVPLIANFNWGMACNPANNGYTIKLKDNSPVYGNMWVTWWQWKINGLVVSSGSNNAVYDYTVPNYLFGTTITAELTVKNANADSCVASQTIAVPALPTASFSIVTTNDSLPTSRSCEGREIAFTNTSTPANIITNIWDFGDNTSLHAQHAAKVYIYNPLILNPKVTLFVMDKYGCSDTMATTINIDKNNLSADQLSGNYTLDPLTPPCFGIIDTVKVNVGGGTPNAYQWYKETIPMQLTTINKIDVGNPGAYWVQLRDANYCYKNINPLPATVSFKYPVPAIITGKQDVCIGGSFTFNAPSGTGLTYSWERDGNIVGTAQTLTENLAVGDYTYILTVSQDGGCASVSPPYHVTVHDLPPPPSIDLSVIDCASYTLELNAYGGGTNYTWSNGKSGSPIQVNNGGAYRVWLTDDYGCRSHADIDVPLSPATYFWRFPTGCYSYCPDDLPKRIDGPAHINFYHWAWLIDDNTVPHNGIYQGDGHHECDPLILNLPPEGSGSGDYSWMLSNGLCEQQSGTMNVEMKEECCKVELWNALTFCDKNNFGIKFGFTEIQGCDTAPYTIYILDTITGQSIAIVSSQDPAFLTPGENSILVKFPIDPALYDMPVRIKIKVFCSNSEPCIGYIDAVLPNCKGEEGGKSLLEHSPPANSEKKSVSELSIVPNPANTEINIAYRFTNDNTAISRSIRVYDAIGRPVTEIKLSNAAGLYNLNVSKYAQGIYFVEIRENNQHILIKRIIIHH